MSWLSDLLGPNTNLVWKALQEGGVIIDLRTAYEYGSWRSLLKISNR
jgi:hypothetical protein